MDELRSDAQENAGASGKVTTAASDVHDRSGVLRQEVEYFIKATAEATDWRSYSRYECDVAVTIAGADTGTVNGRTRNVSRGGAAIDCAQELVAGTACSVEGLLEAGVPARVVQWSDGVLRVQFAQDQGVQARLAAFIAERYCQQDAA
jgi:hypothetical protein